MRRVFFRAAALLFSTAAIALAACSTSQVQTNPQLPAAGAPPASSPARRLASPSEVLYVLIGAVKNRTPSVAAFDGNDSSSDPKPLYTIRPNGIGSYDYLAVDSNDNLFVDKGLAQSTKIYMFAPGQNKPAAVCNLPYVISAITVAGGTLYAADSDGSDSIQEFAEPFTGGTCATPKKTLVDEIAQREGGSYLWGLGVDPAGSIFDIYEGGPGATSMHMDEFTAGTDHSHAFLNLGQSFSTFYMAIDKHKNLVTSLQDYNSDKNDYLAIFPHETKKPSLEYPLGNGVWQSLAFAKNQTELFAISDYPTTKVSVFGYDAATGKIGNLKRTIGGLWMYDQILAVYSNT